MKYLSMQSDAKWRRAMIISKICSIVFAHLDIENITLKGKQCTKPICYKATASRQFNQVLFIYTDHIGSGSVFISILRKFANERKNSLK